MAFKNNYTTKDYYNILIIAPDASAVDVRKAYKQQSRKYHPDKNKDLSAVQQFLEVQEAYNVLNDEDERNKYDEIRRRLSAVRITISASQTYNREHSHSQTFLPKLGRHTKNTAISASAYFGLFFLNGMIFPNIFRIYTLMHSNPELAKEINDIILQSTKNVTNLNPNLVANFENFSQKIFSTEIIYSPICDEILKTNSDSTISGLLSRCNKDTIHAKSVNLTFTHQTPNRLLTYIYPEALEFSNYGIPSPEFAAVTALVFAGKHTYNIYKKHGQFFGPSLSSREKAHRIFLLILMLAVTLMALDAAFNTFNILPSVIDEHYSTPAFCAKACNEVFSVKYVIEDVPVLFKHNVTKAYEYLPNAASVSTIKKAAAIAVNAVVPAVTFFGARWLGNKANLIEDKKPAYKKP